MIGPDLINGTFELGGGLMQWMNVRRIVRDRKVTGVDWRFWGFFSAWGVWNLYFYPHLQQPASFAGGVVLVTGNLVWTVLAAVYTRKARPSAPISTDDLQQPAPSAAPPAPARS